MWALSWVKPLGSSTHVAKNNQKVDGRKWEAGKGYFTAIGNHLLDNPDYAANYSEGRFSIFARARNEFELHTLESIFIQTLKPELC